jgi:cobalt/nickel transport protein
MSLWYDDSEIRMMIRKTGRHEGIMPAAKQHVAFLMVACLGWPAFPVHAHYNMLLPATATAKKGEDVTFMYQWGHPFEHQLFDAPSPEELFVLDPDGKRSDLFQQLRPATVPAAEGKQARAFRFHFIPEGRGDYLFILKTPPTFMEEDGEFLQDTVKVVLHVQAQKGWSRPAQVDYEIVPLTRPYGLLAGMTFQGRVLTHQGPQEGNSSTRSKVAAEPGTLIEVERYNAAPPRELPPDEQITRTLRTDPNGVATTTLTDPGWWALTASRAAGTRPRGGKDYPVRQRTSMWVFVDGKGSK